MKVVTSPYRISLLGVVLVGMSIIFVDPVASQYAEVHRVVERVVDAGPSLSGAADVLWTIIYVFPISAIISFLMFFFMIGLGLIFAEPDGEIVIDLSGFTLIITELQDPRVEYDDKITLALVPTYFIALVFGYISEFVTTLFVWFVVTLFISLALTLIVNLSIGTTQPSPTSTANGSGGQTSLRMRTKDEITRIFKKESGCPECVADLTEYDDPKYCPDCGFQLRRN